MNLEKDIKDELEREIYLLRQDFISTLYNENMVYSERLKKLIFLSKEITILISTFNTVDALINPPKKQDGDI